MARRQLLLLFAFVFQCRAAAFVYYHHSPQQQQQKGTQLFSIQRRREVLLGGTTTACLPFLLFPNTANANEIDDAFANVKDEAQTGVQFLRDKLNRDEFGEVFEFTKTYDIVLRKVKMGKARKLIDDKTATDKANAITWDLIGINRNVRPGKENRVEALKYVDELEKDVQTFLNLRPSSS